MIDGGLAQLSFRLVVNDGRALLVPPGRRNLGRDPEAHLVLDTERASWQHAALLNLYGQLWIEDLASTNGTFVNDQRIRAVALRSGDVIRIGGTTLSVEAAVPVAAGPKTRESGAIVQASRPAQGADSAVDAGAIAAGADATLLRRKLIVLYRLGTLLAEASDPGLLSSAVLALCLEAFGAARVFLCLLPSQGAAQPGGLSILRALAGDAIDDTAQPSQSIVGRVLAERVAIATLDAGHDERFRGAGSVFHQGIRSAMAAPLWDNQRIGGVLYVDSLVETCLFNADDLSLLESIANQTSLALTRAHAMALLASQRAELERWNDELNRRVAARTSELEGLHLARQQFAELAAHDLRNPLAPLQGNLRLLRRELADTPQAALLDDASAAALALDGLVGDLYDSMALESQTLKPACAWVALAPLCNEIARRHAAGARDRDLTVASRVDGSVFGFIDARMIARAVENLVGNAMRYAPPGGSVRIEARVVAHSPSAGANAKEATLELAVVDDGPGVPLEARPHVFRKYARVGSDPVTANPTGRRHRGLGLYFCQLAVAAHGGQITVEGGAGDSRFVIRLTGRQKGP